jgi:hypothetical protein
MPISQYNHLFAKDKGDSKGAAQKLHNNLIKEYGPKKGDEIFYKMVNDRKNAHTTAIKKRTKGNGSKN